MPHDPFAALGEYLTANEAEGLAVLLEAGEHTAHALHSVSATRHEHVAKRLTHAGLSHADPAVSAAVLRAVAGREIR